MKEVRMKNWNETKTNDSWALFKIMGEFVNGYEKLSSIGPCISIFGSARTHANHPTYLLTVEIAKAISELGYGIISGGRPHGILSIHLRSGVWLQQCHLRQFVSRNGNGWRDDIKSTKGI